MDTQATYHLTKKEMEIILLLKKGLSNKSISIHCGISENTVKFHLKNIYKKLKVNNRMQAVYQLNN